MKSENDILAEYVRKRYPSIVTSMDFAFYRIAERIKDGFKSATEALSFYSKENIKMTDDIDFCEDDEEEDYEDEIYED